jgi:hypothetical protein
MSVSALPAAAARSPRTETRILLVMIWAVAAFSLVMSFGTSSLSPDDAMRLVQVRDLLNGQSWFDLAQYRLDPPAGVVTHWSRLVDLPLALLVGVFKLFVPQAAAEKATLALWPTALLFAYLAGVAQIARLLAGETAARIALLFAVLMAPVLQHFRIDSIHHHNVQIVLVTWTLALLLRGGTRDAGIAGGLAALSIAVGQEMAPAIAALAVVVAARWIVLSDNAARPTIAFGIAIGNCVLLLMLTTVPPAQYLTVHCDSLSVAQAGALALGGFGLAAAASLPLNTVATRVGAAAVLGVALAAFVGAGAPQCLADPYARLDPRLAEVWLASVSEARSVLAMLRDLPQQVPATFGVPLIALALGLVQCLRTSDETRWRWIAATAAQAVFAIIALWQVRGAAGANAVAAALFPAALIALLPARDNAPARLGLNRTALIALLLLNPVSLLALGSAAARAFTAEPRFVVSGEAGTCQQPADYTPLSRLPRGRVLAFIDAGPFILMQSGDAAFGAPYHRNEAGNLATLDMFMAAPAEAARQMAARRIDYVAFCPGSPERYQYARLAPRGLAAALAMGETPDFLERLNVNGTDLVLFRVRR